jgi:hypothetical protein
MRMATVPSVRVIQSTVPQTVPPQRHRMEKKSAPTEAALTLRRWVQIALKPAPKIPGLHRVCIRGKGLKYVIADSAFKRMQIDARVCRLDACEHHRGLTAPAYSREASCGHRPTMRLQGSQRELIRGLSWGN